jgi:hypothetical protein
MNGPGDTFEKPILVLSCDPGHRDMTVLTVALQRLGKLEIIECFHAEPNSTREDEIRDLLSKVNVPELKDPLPPPSAVPYWRRFERKRRAR